MGKEPVNIRCSPDTIEAVEQYADDNDLGTSEAYRRCIREGVMLHGDYLDAPDTNADDDLRGVAQQYTLLAILSVGASTIGSVLTLAATGVL